MPKRKQSKIAPQNLTAANLDISQRESDIEKEIEALCEKLAPQDVKLNVLEIKSGLLGYLKIVASIASRKTLESASIHPHQSLDSSD